MWFIHLLIVKYFVIMWLIDLDKNQTRLYFPYVSKDLLYVLYRRQQNIYQVGTGKY